MHRAFMEKWNAIFFNIYTGNDKDTKMENKQKENLIL